MAISQARFESVCTFLNRKLRFGRPQADSKLLRTMLYIYAPHDEYADENGMIEICAFASPRFLKRIPRHDFIGPDGEKVRGYNSVFKILVRSGIVRDRARLKKMIPDALTPTRGRLEVKHDDPNAPKGPSIPFTAYEPVPVGWKRERSYFF